MFTLQLNFPQLSNSNELKQTDILKPTILAEIILFTCAKEIGSVKSSFLSSEIHVSIILKWKIFV